MHGNRFIERTGNRYGSLVVLELFGSDPKNQDTLWKCQCDCGKVVIKRGANLNKVRTCGKTCGVGLVSKTNMSVNNTEQDFPVYGIVYKIVNKVDNKIYIGQSIFDVETRWKKHLEYALKRNGDGYLQRAIRVHGQENFIIETIDYASSKEHLDFLEKFHINAFDALNPEIGYNQTWQSYRSEEKTKSASEKQLGELNHYYREDLVPEELKKLYESGMTLSQIAQKFDTTHHTIAVRLRSIGASIKEQPGQKDLPDSEIIEEYKSGSSISELARKHGVSNWTIHSRLTKAGTDIRRAAPPDNGLKRHDVNNEDLLAAYNSGTKISELSRIYKMDRKTIRERLKQNSNKFTDRRCPASSSITQSTTLVS